MLWQETPYRRGLMQIDLGAPWLAVGDHVQHNPAFALHPAGHAFKATG